MSYRQLTVDNRSALKRFSHRRRFLKAVDLLAAADGQRVLDYGSGDGHMLALLGQRWARCELVGYDPMPAQFDQLQQNVRGTPIEAVADTGRLADASFDRIACCEVLEHLAAAEQRRVLADLRRLVKPDGRVVVSVPLETGPAALAKNLVRRAIGQAHENAGLGNVLRALLGMHCPRDQRAAYISGHVGFRHRDLLPLFEAAGLTIVRRAWSPLPWVGPLLNAQVLYVLRPVTLTA